LWHMETLCSNNNYDSIKKKRRQARVDELPDSVHVTCAPDCLMRIVFDMIMKGPNEQHEGLIRAKLVSHSRKENFLHKREDLLLARGG
jgi:hypothetical protein